MQYSMIHCRITTMNFECKDHDLDARLEYRSGFSRNYGIDNLTVELFKSDSKL